MSWFISRMRPERKKHVRGLVRAAAYIGALGLVFGAIQIRHARAEVRDRTMELGRQMARLANASQHDVNRLTINGQTMYIASSLAHDPPNKILDRYQTYCEENAAQSPEAWKDLAKKSDAPADKKPFLSTGVLRAGDTREGTVTCFTKTASSKSGIGDAMKSFAQTGNLGDLGAARYVYSRVTDQGNTLVLTAWTDDKFNVPSFVGEEGKEAQGEDFAEIPRPTDSSRVFSARLEGTPYGVNVYRSKQPPSVVAKFYDEELIRMGWMAFDVEMENRDNTDGKPQVGRAYEKDGVILSLMSKLDTVDGTFTALGLAGATGNGLPEGGKKTSRVENMSK